MLGSLLIGVPVGLGLALLEVRVLSLFFALPSPLLTIPAGALAGVQRLHGDDVDHRHRRSASRRHPGVRPAPVLREP